MCKSVEISCLTERWISLSARFGVKTLTNDRFKHWFENYKIDRPNGFSDRNNKNKFNLRVVPAKRERYRQSLIPALIRILREK